MSLIEILKEKVDLLVDLAIGGTMLGINVKWAEMVADHFTMANLEGVSKVLAMLAGGIYFVYRIISYHRDAKLKKLDIDIKKEQLKKLKNK